VIDLREARLPGNPRGPGLDLGPVDLLRRATHPADEMVMVRPAAPAIETLAVGGSEHVDLTGVGERLQVPIHRCEADPLPRTAKLGVQLLRTAEGVAVREGGEDRLALTRPALRGGRVAHGSEHTSLHSQLRLTSVMKTDFIIAGAHGNAGRLCQPVALAGSDHEGHATVTHTSVLELRDAACRVGDRVLWREVELTVGAGEFVAILGPNGVGKSTLIKAVLGLIPLSAGTMSVLGRAPGEANDAIGYLPQRRSFPASLRIRGVDVVRLGLDGTRWGIPLPGAHRWSRRARADSARVQEVIRLVGAERYAERPVGELSGGEQQRLLIAQALASRPRMLLLDEPLDSLDLPNQSAIAGLISRICRDDGVTVMMVAHDVNPILRYLDRVVYIAAAGVAVGDPREVITSETLSRLYATPIEVLSTSDGQLVVVGHPEAPAYHTDRHVH
jgi:zinc/manganese transport system ATP-binding protein